MTAYNDLNYNHLYGWSGADACTRIATEIYFGILKYQAPDTWRYLSGGRTRPLIRDGNPGIHLNGFGEWQMSMQIASELAALRSAHRRGEIGWMAIADRLREIERDSSWRDAYGSRAEWLEGLESAVGYAPSTARKLIEARDFLELLERDDPELFRSLSSPKLGVAAIETIKRIRSIAPDRLAEVVAQLKAGKMSVRKVRAFYEKVVRERPRAPARAVNASRRAASEFIDRALGIIAAHAAALTTWPDAVFVRRRLRLPTVVPQAIAVKDELATEIDGFEALFCPTALPTAQQNRVFNEIAVAATFFHHFWVILPEGSRFRGPLVNLLEKMKFSTIGIIELDGEQGYKGILQPSGKPRPDHQQLTRKQVIRQGIAPKVPGRRNAA